MQFYLLEVKSEEINFVAVYHPNPGENMETFAEQATEIVRSFYGDDVEVTFKKDINNEYTRRSPYYESFKNAVFKSHAKYN